jgi:hypothetical protein
MYQRRCYRNRRVMIHIAVELQVVHLQSFQLPNSAVFILPQGVLIFGMDVVVNFCPDGTGFITQEAAPVPATVSLTENTGMLYGLSAAYELHSIAKAKTLGLAALFIDTAVCLSDPVTVLGGGSTDAQNVQGLLRLFGDNHIQNSLTLAQYSKVCIYDLDRQLVLAGLGGSILVVTGETFALLAGANNGISIGVRRFDYASVKQLKGIAYDQVVFFG